MRVKTNKVANEMAAIQEQQYPRHSFQKSALATAVATALLGGSSLAMAQVGSASAEASEAAMMEEVVVYGIRGSLMRAMDQKRDAQGVLEAITAEDIGKMPDTNLAESLQRLTGVSIDRANGEGSRVTVRGFGPDYNVVTLNGRHMPAANIEDTTASASRSFDFAQLAAEVVSGVQVYKTGQANKPTGGIGSIINVETIRPLDIPNQIISVGGKILADSTNKDGGSDQTPEISGIYANSFMDGTFGIAVAASYAERDSGFAQGGTTSGWFTIPGGQGDWGSIAPDSKSFVNAPQSGDIYSVPRNINYAFGQIQRERTNAMLTLQYEPIEELTATLDYTFSEYATEEQRHDFGAWFNGAPASGEFTPGCGSGCVVALTTYTDNTGSDFTAGVGQWGRVNEMNSLALNVEWRPTDNLSLAFDFHSADAENGAADNRRGTNNIVTGVQFNRSSNTVDYRGDLPAVVLGLSQPLNTANMITSGTTFRNSYMKHEIDQFQMDGVYEFDDMPYGVTSIDFGISHTVSKNRSAFANAQRDEWGGYSSDIRQHAYNTLVVNEAREAEKKRLELELGRDLSEAEEAAIRAANPMPEGAADMAVMDARSKTFRTRGLTEAEIAAINGRNPLPGETEIARISKLRADLITDSAANKGRDLTDAEIKAIHDMHPLPRVLGSNTVDHGNDYTDTNYSLHSLPGEFKHLTWSGELQPLYIRSNFDGLINEIATIAANDPDMDKRNISPCGTMLCAKNPLTAGDRTDRTVEETQMAMYAQANFAWDDLDRPINMSIGLRYEDTEVDANGFVPNYTRIEWTGDNEFTAKPSGGTYLTDTGDYSYWLPNVDFVMETSENTVFRASYSVTLTRPGFQDLQGGTTIGTILRSEGGSGSKGNPNLKPFESTNWDFSAEAYYDEGSYLSAGYYRKEVRNFIGSGSSVESPYPELRHPGRGPRYDQAVRDLTLDDDPNTDPTNLGHVRAQFLANTGGDNASAADDPVATFRLTEPTNARSAFIDGVELAWQHMLSDTGFGWILNYTTVSGDIEYDNFNTNKGAGAENQFALLGLSDSANAVFFYDKHGVQARLAYNWRDDFLTGTVDGNGEPNPIYTEDYSQIDLSISYELPMVEGLSFIFEGINITDETRRLHGRHENMVILAIEQGARYSLGVRYNFNQ